MDITRAEVKEIANAIYDAGFNVFGVGNYDISRDEFCNVLMIALTREDKAACLKRYYEILHDRVFVHKKRSLWLRLYRYRSALSLSKGVVQC